jgi:hypothetical protein
MTHVRLYPTSVSIYVLAYGLWKTYLNRKDKIMK